MNGVHPSPFRAGRVVGVIYTDFAANPGARRCRFETLFGPAPAEAMQTILRRVDLTPAEVKPRALAQGDVAILARMPEHAPEHLNPGKVRPICFLTEGLSEAEAGEALRQLMRQGWRP